MFAIYQTCQSFTDINFVQVHSDFFLLSRSNIFLCGFGWGGDYPFGDKPGLEASIN